MRFKDIPQFISDGSYECVMKLENFVRQIQEWVDEEGLQLCPDFQRGHVWTEEQQIRFMEFILQDGKTGRTIYLNNPYWHNVRPKDAYSDFVCVDGLQRITAIQRFLNNEIRVFGQLYAEYEGKTDLMRHGMKVNINDLKTKREVLHWYIQMNSGGTPHSPEEIQRVQKNDGELLNVVSSWQMLLFDSRLVDSFLKRKCPPVLYELKKANPSCIINRGEQ